LGDQAEVWLSEDPAAGHEQEPQQDPSSGSTDELVFGTPPTDANVLNMGLVCLMATNPGKYQEQSRPKSARDG
jgi:hypothetical protein